MDTQKLPTIAIGGLGGSGTRVGAALLQALGYAIGDDLNEALDNLWFTLLFKRRSVLIEDAAKLEALYAMFQARLRGSLDLSSEQSRMIADLAAMDRVQHSGDWLSSRVQTFLERTGTTVQPRIGWKEPNTHVIIDRLFMIDPGLRYIHFERDPIYMASSRNQNQLVNWGPVFLDRDVSSSPRDSLSYWCAVHRRIESIRLAAPERILVVSYDALVAAPATEEAKIAAFIGEERSAQMLGRLVAPELVRATANLADAAFDAADLAYVDGLGYRL